MITTKTKKAIERLREQLRSGVQGPKMGQQTRMEPKAAVLWQAALILEGRRGIITRSQTKLDKASGTKTGYVNRGLTLSSANEAAFIVGRGFTTCPNATASCRVACVGSKTGQGALPSSKIARIGRTLAMLADSERFNALLDYEIESERMRCAVFGFKLAFRFNVASDLWALANECAERNPLVTFYDYSAVPAAFDSPSGVRRVYSRKNGKASAARALGMLERGVGVSVVFAVSKKDVLPLQWNGVPVIDGDINDLWFLRAPKSGAFVVGLRVKGSNKQKQQAIDSGFAVAA